MPNETERLFDFIASCPDPYHTSQTVCDILKRDGYLQSEEYGERLRAGKYYLRRGNATVAFRIPEGIPSGFMICAAHIDSPAFRIKPAASYDSAGYSVISAERYGGMINYTWLDRPLELSGRAVLRGESGVRCKLFRSCAPAAIIPSVAPHLNRKINTELTLNTAKDLVPLFGNAGDSLAAYIAELCGGTEEETVAFDATLSCMDRGFTFGKDLISAPRLDDLMCVYTMLEGFLSADESCAVPICCLYDGEEVGSAVRDGAASDLLPSVLRRISGDEDTYRKMLKNTLLVSADNAHAVHPNHPELSDAASPVRLNGGVAVKKSASRSYMTEATSSALISELCRRANVPCQYFANRSDLAGGSTLAAYAVKGLPVLCADIGAPQLAMHSALETAGRHDITYLTELARELYSSSLTVRDDEITIKRGV